MLNIIKDIRGIINNFLKKNDFSFLKNILNRKRLKFSKNQIRFYLEIITFATIYKCRFKTIFNKLELNISYQNFMKNIKNISILFHYIFLDFNKENNICFSETNIVDSTDIEDRNLKNFNWKDKTRFVKKQNKITIGIKLLAFINNKNQICKIDYANINTHDSKLINQVYLPLPKMKNKIFIADKGFNSQKIRDLFENNNIKYVLPLKNSAKDYDSLILYDKKSIKFSHNLKSDINLKNIYQQRYKIEHVFSNLKNKFYNQISDLFIMGGYSKEIKICKINICCLIYNLTKI